MNTDLLPSLAAWAWHTSLDALPLAVVSILVWRWQSLPTAWRWWLPALFFLRLAMPQVPQTDWHSWKLPHESVAAVATVSATPAAASASHEQSHKLSDFLPAIWLLGVAAVGGWLALSQWRLRRSIALLGHPADSAMQRRCGWAAARMALSARIAIRVMPRLPTMAVCGWWRPTLLVPDDLDERFTDAQIRGMLLHEMAHVRRRDVLWTWLALGLCALHWFNPLAWLALRRFHADRELACDAAALRALDASARHDYGEALLLCLQGSQFHPAPAVAPFFRRFPELKQRIQNIMTPAAPTRISRLLAALLIPSLIAITFTTARAQRDGAAAKPDLPTLCRRLYLDLAGKTPTPAEVQAFTDAANRDKQAAISDLVIRLTAAEKRAARDGEREKPVARDGDRPREGQRDGDMKRRGPRDGDQPKAGARDGDQPKRGLRDGDQPKAGPRDGEVKKDGPRDGDQPRRGPRDGDGAAKAGARDGDAPKAGPREGDRGKADGEKPEAR